MPTPIELPDLRDGDLRLRPVEEGDVPVVTAICQDPEIQHWTRVPSPYTEDDGRAYHEMSRRALAEGRGVHLLAVDGDDVVLAAVGFDIDVHDRACEVGYWVAPAARGRGVAVAATRVLLRWALGDLGLGRCTLRAATENAGSNAVARRLGFTLEGTLRQAFLVGPRDDPRRTDANVWGLLPGELRE